MDFQHGVLLLVIGLFFTLVVFAIILYAEQPVKDKDKDLNEIQKQIRDLFKF